MLSHYVVVLSMSNLRILNGPEDKRYINCMARVREGRDVHRFLMGKPEGKRPLGRPRHRWEDNIKMDLQEVGGSWLRIGTGGGRLWVR